MIADAYETDPASAAAEYGASFRVDVEALLSRETVEASLPPAATSSSRPVGLAMSALLTPLAAVPTA